MSPADIPRPGQDGITRTIRFRRVVTKTLSEWFAYVQGGIELKINGQTFHQPRDTVVGPFTEFSVLEYNKRVVFLFLSQASVDYNPAREKKHPLSPMGRVVDAAKQGLAHLRSKNGSASEKKGTAAPGSPLRKKPAILPKNADPCAYFNRRIQEWRKLRAHLGVRLEAAALYPRAGETPQWLLDSVVYRAIASVTTALELENGVQFAQLDQVNSQLARNTQLDGPQSLIGPGQELFMPYNHGMIHWLLVRVRNTESGPEISSYNSSTGIAPPDDELVATVLQTGWYSGLSDMAYEVRHVPTVHQARGWECGYITIMNAWCLALGLTPSGKYARFEERYKEVIEVINLAMSGLMDSATILALARCIGFVTEDSTAVAEGRDFTRTVPFLTGDSLVTYTTRRWEIEQSLHAPAIRLDVDAIRYILEHTDFRNPTPDQPSAAELIQDFSRWLRMNGIELATDDGVDSSGPLSPVSPTTIRRAFKQLAEVGFPSVPKSLPENLRLLRQIWNVYHGLLKENDVLPAIRQKRQQEKEEQRRARHDLEEDADGVGIDYYPYSNPVYNTLDRLSMLPSTQVLSPEDDERLAAADAAVQTPPGTNPEEKKDKPRRIRLIVRKR